MKPQQFLRWYEVLLVQLLVRSPRVEGILVRSAEMPVAWVLRKTVSQECRESLERSYRASSP
jgi:hypothetical protein